MPFLKLHKITIQYDGMCEYTVGDFLIKDNAHSRLREQIETMKKDGAEFDPNTGPSVWRGSHEGVKFVITLQEKEFHDNARLYCPELTVYS